MTLQDLLTAEKAPSAEQINTAIFGFLSALAEKFEKRDDANPWRNSPAQCLQRMTIQMATLAYRDDDIAHLLKVFRLGENASIRAMYGHDTSDTLDTAADELTELAEKIASDWKREATEVAA